MGGTSRWLIEERRCQKDLGLGASGSQFSLSEVYLSRWAGEPEPPHLRALPDPDPLIGTQLPLVLQTPTAERQMRHKRKSGSDCRSPSSPSSTVRGALLWGVGFEEGFGSGVLRATWPLVPGAKPTASSFCSPRRKPEDLKNFTTPRVSCGSRGQVGSFLCVCLGVLSQYAGSRTGPPPPSFLGGCPCETSYAETLRCFEAFASAPAFGGRGSFSLLGASGFKSMVLCFGASCVWPSASHFECSQDTPTCRCADMVNSLNHGSLWGGSHVQCRA